MCARICRLLDTAANGSCFKREYSAKFLTSHVTENASRLPLSSLDFGDAMVPVMD
jgi:hypothetical protein